MEAAQILLRTFNFNLGGITISPSYWQAGAIVFLLFILIVSMAQFRRHLLDWTAKGAVMGLFFGFLLTLVLEGFLIVGGKTALIELLGWKDAPKPLVNVLDAGRSKLTEVLGVTSEISESNAHEATVEGIIDDLQSLSPADNKRARFLICAP